MPRRSKRREEDLVHAAIQALEDEVRCWREGPSRYYDPRRRSREDEVVTLIRYPRMDLTIGPADYIPEAEATVRHLDMPRKEVPFFLRWQGMEAAIKVIREFDSKPEPAELVPSRNLERIDEAAQWIA